MSPITFQWLALISVLGIINILGLASHRYFAYRCSRCKRFIKQDNYVAKKGKKS